MCSLRVRSSPHGTLLAAVLAVACFAIPPAHAVPMLFPGLPDAMFNPAGDSPLRNLASICQVTDDLRRRCRAVGVLPDGHREALRDLPGAPALRRQSRSSPVPRFTRYVGPWNENVTPPLTLSGTVTPGSGAAALGAGKDWQVDSSQNSLIPGPGSVLLALGVVATLAAFRLHDSFRA